MDPQPKAPPVPDKGHCRTGSNVFAKFDTSEEKLEPLSAELQVKALPVFKFYKDGREVVQQVVGYKKKPLEAAVEQLAATK